MIDLQTRPHSLIGNFNLIEPILKSYGPESLQPLREGGLAAFEKVGIPTPADEEFKYLPLKLLEEGQFKPAYGATVERTQVEKRGMGQIDAITLAFVNGEFSPELSSDHVLPEGVFVGTLMEGMADHESEILDKLGKAASLKDRLGSSNDERFVALNTAYLGEGAFVYVPEGVGMERPVHLLWVTSANRGSMVAHPRNLVVLGNHGQAKIVESYVGLEGHYFTNSVTEIFLGESAILELTRFQDETDSAVHISSTGVMQSSNSAIVSNCLNFGGQIVRNDINVWVGGQHAETSLNGASIGTGRQVIDNHTRIDHAMPNCHSFETYKTILKDSAHGIFNGKIFVYQDAQKTDAKQTNQSLLLSRQATMDTKPQLEIFADDVKCTHGATVGQLSEESLFYLQSRGIPKSEAQALLVYAFAAEVLAKISLLDVRELTEKILYRKLDLTSLASEVS